jgi:hypothetical protein
MYVNFEATGLKKRGFEIPQSEPGNPRHKIWCAVRWKQSWKAEPAF